MIRHGRANQGKGTNEFQPGRAGARLDSVTRSEERRISAMHDAARQRRRQGGSRQGTNEFKQLSGQGGAQRAMTPRAMTSHCEA